MRSQPSANQNTSADAPLVLASASPRRHQLLEAAGQAFVVAPAGIDEGREPDEAPDRYVLRLAHAKAAAVAERFSDHWILGADTVVVLEGAVLGKPRDEGHALELLRALAGKTHSVLTGVAVVPPRGDPERLLTESRVTFREARDRELLDYLALGESLDKAGGYALQGAGRRFVTRVEGDESNVIGLPVESTLALLRRHGCPASWKEGRGA